MEAVQQEIDLIKKNHMWEVVDRPQNKVPMTTKWSLIFFKGPLREAQKLKAKIVARGFQQTTIINYFDIFALVVQ
jgi:hypothetical protein